MNRDYVIKTDHGAYYFRPNFDGLELTTNINEACKFNNREDAEQLINKHAFAFNLCGASIVKFIAELQRVQDE